MRCATKAYLAEGAVGRIGWVGLGWGLRWIDGMRDGWVMNRLRIGTVGEVSNGIEGM